jgi:hypothetical protein
VRRIPPFAIGQVLGALAIGAVAGSFLDAHAIITFGIVMAIGAAASALVCRWWPGYAAPGWRLWLAGTAANPLFIVALGFSIDSYECLLGRRTGWDCLFSDVGPMVAGVCLFPPIFGVALRVLRKGPRDAAATPRPPGSAGPGSSTPPR